jgi:hypothetical protein
MIFSRRTDVLSRREGDKTLLFHQTTGRLCILNPTSTFLWEHCDGSTTPEQIAELLPQRFEMPEEYGEGNDVLSLVTRHLSLLEKAQLLETDTA